MTSGDDDIIMIWNGFPLLAVSARLVIRLQITPPEVRTLNACGATMESLGNGSLTPSELQCLPEKYVGRRSVEVTKVVQELYGPPDESREWSSDVLTTGRSPGCTKHTECVLNNISLDSKYGLEDSVHQLTEEITFPECIEPDTTMETKMCEPHKETKQPRHAGGSRVSTLQITTLGDKASRGSLSKNKADGYEAAFLRNKIRGAGKMSGSSAISSPTESLEDLLYRKTKRVFDYSVKDMRGQRSAQCIPLEFVRMPPMIQSSSGAPSVTYSKRTEHTLMQSRVVRRKEDNQHSLQVKVNKAWMEPEKSSYNSRVTTQRADTASGPQPVRKSSDIIRKEKKGVYYTELSRQVQERSQLMERERRKNADAEQVHNETMQFGIWGKLGGGAPNPTTVRRTKFSSTGLRSQDQVPYQGFAGIPFHLRF
ncbi:uncharacterized protein LOC125309152 [Alosa alosa]|nr:uncharacterized protein LOC125309152 [Alosa alosa]